VEKAEELGNLDIKEKYNSVQAVIPLKQPVKGLKVRIDDSMIRNFA
jgi:hypothetical protein